MTVDSVNGDIINLLRTNSKHLGAAGTDGSTTGPAADFVQVLSDALDGVNALEQESQSVMQTMIIDPDSIDPHDVTIAMSEANLAVSITKAVLDGAIKAYKEIINMR